GQKIASNYLLGRVCTAESRSFCHVIPEKSSAFERSVRVCQRKARLPCHYKSMLANELQPRLAGIAQVRVPLAPPVLPGRRPACCPEQDFPWWLNIRSNKSHKTTAWPKSNALQAASESPTRALAKAVAPSASTP